MKIPKKTKYKKYHRLNKNFKKRSSRANKLIYGYWGLKALGGGTISAKQIEAVRQTINRKIRPVGRLWIRIFPDAPITSKPVGVRMGKGKGSVEEWVSIIRPGQVLYEIGGVSETKAITALKFGAKKLSMKTKVISY